MVAGATHLPGRFYGPRPVLQAPQALKTNQHSCYTRSLCARAHVQQYDMKTSEKSAAKQGFAKNQSIGQNETSQQQPQQSTR